MEFLASLAVKVLIGTSVCGTITVGTIYTCDKTLLGFKDNAQTTEGDRDTTLDGEKKSTGGGPSNSETPEDPRTENEGSREKGKNTEGTDVSTPNAESEKQEDVNNNEAEVSVGEGTEDVEAIVSGSKIAKKVTDLGQESDIEKLPVVNQPVKDNQSDSLETNPLTTQVTSQSAPAIVSLQPQTITDSVLPASSDQQPQEDKQTK